MKKIDYMAVAEEAMAQVKEAFDELNGSPDTESEADPPTDRDESAQDKETS